MSKFLLGIDIGTSACKAAVFDTDGTLIGSSSADYKVYYPEPGYAEQNPEEWWEAVCIAIKKTIKNSGISPEMIAAVGVDGQSWSAIPVAEDGRILHNTPIWMDTRSDSICDSIIRKHGNEVFFNLCGNSFKPSYTTPKILWFKKNKPDVYKNAHKFLQSNSYIIYRLTGKFSQDKSQGYGLHFFDMKNGTWSEKTADLLEIDLDKMPEIYGCSQIVAEVTSEAAEASGLIAGIPVVAGGLDACCGTLGAGVINPGQTQEQGGQAGGMSICIDSALSDPSLILSCHVIDDRWLLQGGTVGGGGSIRWLKDILYSDAGEKVSDSELFRKMSALGETVPAGSEGLVFLPYMAGERSPIWDPKAKGVFFGLGFDKKPAHLIRSVFEGTAFALRHNIETAANSGVHVSKMNAMGGAANSGIWTQIKCNVTGIPIAVPASDTATTLGAAMLAGTGCGLFKNFSSAVDSCVRITREHVPDSGIYQRYEEFYEIYKELYVQLAPLMAKTDKLIHKGF
ncbi:MAG: FGGY-family carbohydrate kinase [Spirochaetes bacterium]|nr:FGGY-family carbohydrate kinase [Spirochaetota bacterium]